MIVLAMALIRPQDVPFGNDEPKLLEGARWMDMTPSVVLGVHLPFTVGTYGLGGTRGWRYGPLPAWIYQIFFALTSEPQAMVPMRAMLCAGGLVVALLWLAKIMEVTPWLVVMTMMSPWIWTYSRTLWDNTFCIPLAALLLAAYADFLKRRRTTSFLLTIVAAAAMLLVHLMSLPIVIAVALHAAATQYRWMWKHKWAVGATLIVLAGIATPYILECISGDKGPPLPVADRFRFNGYWFPLLGAHHLSGSDFLQNTFGPDFRHIVAGNGAIGSAAESITLLMYLAAWVGMLLAIWRLICAARGREPITWMHHLLIVSLATYLLETALDAYKRVFYWPHYHNGTWIVYALFVWIAIDSLGRFAVAAEYALIALETAALTVIVAMAAVTIARNAGTGDAGATLGEQERAIHQMRQFASDSPTDILLDQWISFPWALEFLKTLPLNEDDQFEHHGRGLIVSAKPAYPGDSRIMVRDYPAADVEQLLKSKTPK